MINIKLGDNEAVCTCIFKYKSTCIYMNIIKIKTITKLLKMSCTAYIVYTFHVSLHHANFGHFKAKQVLLFHSSPITCTV